MVIKLQILLRKDWRTPEGLDAVKKIAAALGITPTAAGAATLSGEMEAQAFESLFGQKAQVLSPQPRGKEDFGTPGGAVAGTLSVPEPLGEYVESISVALPYTRMGGTREGSPE